MRPPPPPPPPRPPPSQARQTNGGKATPATAPSTEVANGQASPLKAAADLIQILDNAYADMSSFAADAARDAEGARRNARAASEIARRYQNRSYPKVHSPFGSSSPPRTPHVDGESKLQENDNPEQTPRHGALSLLSTMNPQHHNTLANPDSFGRMRTTYNTPTSTERLAQSHAEEVLSLSLELERAKQDYISEKKSHEHTQASMLEIQCKNKSLERQLGILMNELEMQRKDSQLKIDSLQEELAHSKRQTEAAEEDAQVALDIAKESAAKREHMEDMLHSSLQEVTLLREQVEHSERSHEGTDRDDSEKGGSLEESIPPEPAVTETPRRSVRFAESPHKALPANVEGGDTALEEPKPDDTAADAGAVSGSGPSRSMIAAGRQLLHRAMARSEGQNVCTFLEVTPAKSAEKMQRLRHRLLGLEDEPILPSPSRHTYYSSPIRLVEAPDNATSIESITRANALEENRAVAKLLKETGRRLELDGSWFKQKYEQFDGIPNVPPPPPPPPGKTQLEALARQFCNRVEVRYT